MIIIHKHTLGATGGWLKTEGNLAGAVLENFVLMELRKQCAWSGVLLCAGAEIIPFASRLHGVPLDRLWSQ